MKRDSPSPPWATDPWGDFDPLPTAEPGDWLSVHRESGQSFETFVRVDPNRPDAERSALVLQPLNSLDVPDAPDPEVLRRFAEIYFGLETVLFPPIDLETLSIRSRRQSSLRHRRPVIRYFTASITAS